MHFWRYNAATDIGLQRDNNEDSYLSCPQLGLWVVADGMGGHAAGEVASAIVSETIKQRVADGDTLANAIQLSHKEVLVAAADGRGSQGMGSTVVALQANNQQYEVSWVGDSRAYLWSPNTQPTLKQVTTDHSYVQMLYQTGAITKDELTTHPEKNIITQCLGSIELEQVNVESVNGEWKNGDSILLCSDGLTDAVPDCEINTILANTKDAHQATQKLIQSALNNGGKDNITVILIEYPNMYRNFLHAFTSSLSKFFK